MLGLHPVVGWLHRMEEEAAKGRELENRSVDPQLVMAENREEKSEDVGKPTSSNKWL